MRQTQVIGRRAIWDALEPRRMMSATTGTIAGTVYAAPTGEPTVTSASVGLAGVTVFLGESDTGLREAGDPSAVTDANGRYTFADVAPGGYDAWVDLPDGQVQTISFASGDRYQRTAAVAGQTTVLDPFAVDAFYDAGLVAAPVAVSVISVGGRKAVAGGDLGTVRLRVTNVSGAAVARLVDGVISVSVDAAVSSGDPTGTSFSFGRVRLPAGRSKTVAVRFTYPTALATGAYHVTADLTFPLRSSSSGLPEGSANADATAAAAKAVTIRTAAVDLSDAFVAPAAGVRLKAGRRATVEVRVTNRGTAAARGGYYVTLYASNAATFDAATHSADAIAFANRKAVVRPGRSSTIRIPFTPPADLTVGDYELFAVEESGAVAAVATRA